MTTSIQHFLIEIFTVDTTPYSVNETKALGINEPEKLFTSRSKWSNVNYMKSKRTRTHCLISNI